MKGTGGFLGVRVTKAFTRLDGTTATIGEPLVKRKFALSRLALVTSSATAAQNAGDPIYDRFGISRGTQASGTTAWIYNHGQNYILPLANPTNTTGLTHPYSVQDAGREPDFAELLKAAINVGSVGKAGPSGQGSNDQYRADVSGDVQILQIMANLIDQQKTNNYPTWIQYTQTVSSGTVTRNIYGDQDLPYFYRWNFYGVTTVVPGSPLSSANTVTLNTSATTTVGLNHTKQGGTLPSPVGSGSYMIIPQVWNPHDANTPVASGGGPTVFRVTVETNFSPSVGATAASAWGILAVPGSAGQVSGIPNIHFDGAPGGFEYADFPVASAPAPLTMTRANSYVQFTDGSGGKAFREPTILWRNNDPSGVTLTGTSRTEDASLTGNTYYGILVSDVPLTWTWSYTDPVSGTTSNYISQTSTLQKGADVPGASGSQTDNLTFRMEYQDPANSANWIPYQETYVECSLPDIGSYALFVNKSEPSYSSNNAWANPLAYGVNGASPPFMRQLSGTFDPRTNRFTAPIGGYYVEDDPTLNGNPTLDAVTMVNNAVPTGASAGTVNSAVKTSNFVLMKTNRPTTARGQYWEYTTPCRGYDSTMHWYSSLSTSEYGNGFNHGGADLDCFDGLLSQNNPGVKILANGTVGWNVPPINTPGTTPNGPAQNYYYEDPDGIARRAMGGYVAASGTPTGTLSNTTTTIGLPLATSGTTFTNGIVTPTSQSQSRPILLHRPFRSVAEMSYAFRGTPWKNVDFFTPESGDTALLDVFCVNEPPSNALIAGKVDLNTRQAPVLKTIFSSAYRDEFANLATPPSSGTLPQLSSTEAGNLASTLLGITTSPNAWEGPLTNISDIVGHFVYPDPGVLAVTDVYQYTSPANSTEYTYSGFSAALSASSGIWDSSNLTASQNIQRFRESAIRPLSDCGQTRVWNLLIDLVAQTGRYPKAATGLDQFLVDGQTRLWVHVAIDRYTGQVLDKQVEVVTP